jgi:hypothetical protein
MPVPGRHDAEVVERVLAPFQEGSASMLRSYSRFDVHLESALVPNSSTITEWSMTRSTGPAG